MPAYVRGIKRSTTKFVRVNEAAPNVYYGFAAKDFDQIPGVTAADLTPLGHKLASTLTASDVKIFRARTPKPIRVKKVIKVNPTAQEQEGITSFCSSESFNTALGAGWKLVTPARPTSLTTNARTITAIIELSNGLNYAFPKNAADFNRFATELGWKQASDLGTITPAELWKIIAGCRIPSPPTCSKPDSGGDATTFYAPGSAGDATAAGWSLEEGERLV